MRDRTTRSRKRYWWQFAETTPALFRAVSALDRVLVAGSQASSHFALAFLPTGMVYSSNLTVLPFQTPAAFAALQSRPHEVWARFFMSTLGRCFGIYAEFDCFETFPFPVGWTERARP